jgi:2-methylcitrate dehydratase PrpD
MQIYFQRRMNMAGLIKEIARFVSQTQFEDLPHEAIEETKRMLLDSIGCAIAGIGTDKGKYAVRVTERMGGPAEATVLATGHKVSCGAAAFANGELINALDMDGLMFPAGHAPPLVTPAPLAIAESVEASGKELIVALAIVYELSVRIAGALSEWREFIAEGPQKGAMKVPAVHGTGACIFGGTAGAGKLLKLDSEKLSHALGIAGHICPVPSMAKWYNTAPNPMTKYISAGWVSQAEVTAVLLAEEGYTGDTTVLDGEYGFWRFYGSTKWQPDLITHKLGEKWRFPSRAIYKPYPCCRAMHGGLDCFIGIMEENNLRPDEIEKVEISIDPLVTLPAWKIDELQSHVDAQFCAPYPFAAAAFRLQSGVEWQTPATLSNSQIMEFMKKVSVKAHPEYGKTLTEDPRSPLSKVEIVARGQRYVKEQNWKKGNPWPESVRMSDKELADKFCKNASRALPKDRIDRVIEHLLHMETLAHISELMRQLS